MEPGFERELAKHKTVGLDTPCFIYEFEQHPRYFPLTHQLFQRVERGEIKASTAVITLTEILAYPLSRSREDLAEVYQVVFDSFPNLVLAPIDAGTAKDAASLRAKYNLATPDALHIASALKQGASAFVTNDVRLKRVAEVEVLVLDDFAACNPG